MALTPKHRRFVAEYLKDQNATQAAIRAGYSEKTAQSAGPRLYGKVEVKAEIEKRLARVAQNADLTLESHLQELARLRDVAIDLGQVSAAVSAEAHRGKAVGLYTEKLEHSGKGGAPIVHEWVQYKGPLDE